MSHEEHVVIAAPLPQVLAAANAQSLEDTIQQGGALPHVTGTNAFDVRAFRNRGLGAGSMPLDVLVQILDEPHGQRRT